MAGYRPTPTFECPSGDACERLLGAAIRPGARQAIDQMAQQVVQLAGSDSVGMYTRVTIRLLRACVLIDIVFITINLREHDGMESVFRNCRLAFAREPIDRAPGPWLACYPIFQEALGSGETTFRALPDYARSVALRRTCIDAAEQAMACATLDDVRVSFIELRTQSVCEAVEDYLGKQKGERILLPDGVTGLRLNLIEHMQNIAPPLMARPPCLLRPGRHIFIDGWMRFFSYTTRGDLTIPLLAIDWLDFHDRLGALPPTRTI